MQQSNAPSKLPLAFAASGGKNVIPTASNPTPGGASLTDGFPPLTRTDPTAGGKPPSGLDMNGILNAISAINRWSNAGGGYAYDGTFATDSNVLGYPKGAVVLTSDGLGEWKNLTENNQVDPEGANTGWIPATRLGAQSVAVSNANVTLTYLQANKYAIALSGTLTANINLILPAWNGIEWLVVGGFSGSFTVTCKTSAGTGVAISSGNNATVYCDGTNIVNSNISSVVSSSGVSGSRKNLQITYTGTTAAVTVTAKELTLGDESGGYVTLRGLNLTASSGNSSGVANSLDTGSWAFSTFYVIYVIYNGVAPALLFSLSGTVPTLPSGYTYFARVGANKTQSATNYYFLSGTQKDADFQYKVASGSNVTSLPIMSSGTQGNPSTPTWAAVSVQGVFVPTSANKIYGVLSGAGATSTNGMCAPNNSYGAITSTTNPPPCIIYSGSGVPGGATPFAFNMESSSIYWATVGGMLICLGWSDNI